MSEAKRGQGQPTKWRLEHNEAIVRYFDVDATRIVTRMRRDKKGNEYEIEEEVATDFLTFEGFAAEIDVDCDTLVEWNRRDLEALEQNLASPYPGFSAAYKKAKHLQKKLLVQNAMSNRYHPIFSIFVAKNATDMRDKQELEHTGKDGAPLFLPTTVVNKNKLDDSVS